MIILEAMKMENEIRSTVSGVVKAIKVKEKTPVEKGEILLILE
ncbi:MAG: biotin/lipoyl-containing protein [Bacteroidota bacterium]|nr:biotin/lipoyl-containing protein [Bacteroidota bacterium]